MNATFKTVLAVAGLMIATQAAAQVTFYERPGFGGRSFTADRPIHNFDGLGFNDRATLSWRSMERRARQLRWSSYCVQVMTRSPRWEWITDFVGSPVGGMAGRAACSRSGGAVIAERISRKRRVHPNSVVGSNMSKCRSAVVRTFPVRSPARSSAESSVTRSAVDVGRMSPRWVAQLAEPQWARMSDVAVACIRRTFSAAGTYRADTLNIGMSPIASTDRNTMFR